MIHPLTDWIGETEFVTDRDPKKRNNKAGTVEQMLQVVQQEGWGGYIADWRLRWLGLPVRKMQLNSKFVNNMLPEWGRFVTAVKLNRGLRDSNYDQLRMELHWIEEQLLFLQDLALNVDNVFQADDCDAFDSDVDEAPTAQTMFMTNLSSTYPVYDEVGPSYDSDILSEEKKEHDKMKDPECVTHKVKIAPPDYFKENYLATFTPQKQLTPEQIFWSQDIIKMKAKALKEQTTASRPTKALTVYPPNTPATLVPRVLPTKRERGFEQTKACYLTEVIPFFKTLKEHFEGIQKALTKEVKEMKEIFEELEAEVDQHVVDRKHDEIEPKIFLLQMDNLIC
ncbi:hypothetical protein Tco_0302583 [Tanacetum coccineum]